MDRLKPVSVSEVTYDIHYCAKCKGHHLHANISLLSPQIVKKGDQYFLVIYTHSGCINCTNTEKQFKYTNETREYAPL